MVQFVRIAKLCTVHEIWQWKNSVASTGANNSMDSSMDNSMSNSKSHVSTSTATKNSLYKVTIIVG